MSKRKLFVGPLSNVKSNKGGPIQLYNPAPTPAPAYGPRKNGSSKNITKMDITQAVRYFDAVFPGIRESAGGQIRQTALAYLQRTGESGLREIRKWNKDNGNGNQPPMTSPNPDFSRHMGAGSLQASPESTFRVAKNNTYALSPAPNPRTIHFGTGIKPNTFVNDYMTPMEGICSPLHITTTTLRFPTMANSPTNPLSSYYESNILFDLQTSVQELVSFGVDLTVFSTANISAAMNDAIFGLSIYYQIGSILSYESDSRNKNAGMIYLRSLIDSTMLSDWVQLGKRLEDLPIPPRIVEWVKFMNGNYLSSNTQGAPLLKITALIGSVNATNGYVANGYNNLVRNNNISVWTLLRRAKPKWRINKLYDIPPVPVYNAQFNTIFANTQSNIMPVSTLVYTNSVVNNSTAFPYNTYTNQLDGMAFAMANVYQSTLGISMPGFLNCVAAGTTYRDNRFSFYKVGGTTGFYTVDQYPFLSLSRQETNTTVSSTLYSPHLFGTDKCQNVTIDALLLNGQSVLDFLFNASNSYKRYNKFTN